MTKVTIDDFVEFVTTHNRIVLLVMLALTAGMVVGVAALDTGGQAAEDEFPETDRSQAADYLEEQYADGNERGAAYAAVYVATEDGGNALSKAALLDSLRYQRAVTEHETVADALADDDRGDGSGPAVTSVANLVAVQLAEEPSADLETQIDALEGADEEAVASLVDRTVADHPEAARLVPESYEPGTATAESHRMLFRFEAGADADANSNADGDGEEAVAGAQEVLYETAGEWSEDGQEAGALETSDDGEPALSYFTLGEPAAQESVDQLNENTMELLVPLTLALVLVVLTVTYRDPLDVFVGMVGVVTTIVWMFGILGWLGISAGMTAFIGPVLIAGLSIDFGFHVFMRYREQRGVATDARADAGIRPSMGRAVRSVSVALGLVAITGAIGFLSNVVNPVGIIRELALGITLGVLSAFVIFLTLVPALKISVDGICERIGIDRRKRPLGEGAVLRPFLRSSVVLARRVAPLVLVVALVAGAGGAVAWTALEEEGVQQQEEPAAEWKQELPGPLAWEVSEYDRNDQYVREEYRPVAAADGDRFQLLIEGDVTEDDTLEQVQWGLEVGEQRGAIADASGDAGDLRSPTTVMASVAAEDEAFAATLEAADTDGDGVPDEDLETVYDALYEAAPGEAAGVIERTDGEYRSLRVVGPPERAGFDDDRVADVEAMAASIESPEAESGRATDADLAATPVSETIVVDSQLGEITDGVVRVLLLALGAVFATLAVVYRYVHGSATLGIVTAFPIALVTGLVVGGMYLLDVPLTLLTALLMSLVIGLGIDYGIHVSDRFAQELERGDPDHRRRPLAALERAVTGTGGALLGSTLTSAGAFATLLLHPHPQLESFGTLVVLAIVTAFVVSVFVLPSALALWARYGRSGSGIDAENPADADGDGKPGTEANA
ncbi:RND transporter [Halobiforma lacisalsi AJ5]|uniref:Exporter of the RND superfamily protein n=1 Tax=Natronobacterium lacisalsi AJ5 TaxID=358396 RepID=M0LY96_NATLA|nr:MMPL family transporter [Halobiforma lacisalsi]APW97549.1 RND transporter [Halobiforma lacisalsi AJ5]EMA37070.1 exporter of the RND superfamily protein [Halobiforma lacisalsi AJ5]